MVTLVLIKNPFSPQDGREVRYIEANCTLEDLLKENAIENVELQATVNGYSVANDTEIKDNDFVVLYPAIQKGGKGKSILGIVAAIALSVVSFGVGSLLAEGGGAFFTLGGATMGFASYAAMAAVMFLGSALMGRFMGQEVDGGSYDTEQTNPTYSWGSVQTMEGQNNSIALTYGTVKSGGQTIGKHIEIDDNEEYLYWLIAAGEGELSITDIKINDNDYENYEDVTVEVRSGTNDQEIISGFNDTYFTKPLNYVLDDNWKQDSTQGSNTQGIAITIEFPNGLCHFNGNSGAIESAYVEFDAEYKINGGEWTNFFKEVQNNDTNYNFGISLRNNVGAGVKNVTITPVMCQVWNDDYIEYDEDGNAIYYREEFEHADITIGNSTSSLTRNAITNGTKKKVGSYVVDTSKWSQALVKTIVDDHNQVTGIVTVTTGAGSGRITGKSRSAIRRQFTINHIPAGAYNVRVRVKERQYPESDTQAVSACMWTAIESIIYDDFIYPCTALVGISAKATDQLSGNPSITFLKTRSKVWVWNGTEYKQRNANNPAWACYDLLHQCRKLKNINSNIEEYEVRGVPADRIRYGDFKAWADWCDDMKLYVNIEINNYGEMLDVINKRVAPIGRGMVVRFGTKYGCIYDHVQQPVQMFGMGNIINGTFNEEFLKVADRANCVEVTFTNKAADYERDVVTVYGDTYNADGYAKTAQLTMDGIVDYEQAFREGKYQLMCNKYQLRTVSFEANIDAIACTVGDVVLVAHDVPKWAYSGRVYKVSEDEITLPCYVTDTSQSYRLQYRKVNNNIYTKPCTIKSSTSDGWTVVTVSDTSNMPQAEDIFDLAIANIGNKPFVIKNITRAQDFTRRISAIEYSESLYDESYEIPPIQYSLTQNERPRNVTNLSAVQYAFTDAYGLKRNMMAVSWKRPKNGGKFTVLISTDGISWETKVTQTESDSVEFDVQPKTAYYVRVITTIGLRQSSGVTTGLISAGVDEPPPDVTNFTVEKLASGTRRLWWDYDYPVPNDIAGFRIKFTQTNNLVWERGFSAQDGLITSSPYETETIRQGYNVVMIKAVDNAGQESKNFAYAILDIGELLEENVLWSNDFSANNWQGVTHNGTVVNGKIVSNRDTTHMWSEYDDYRWSGNTDYAWNGHEEDLEAYTEFIAQYSGQFWLKANISGAAMLYYATSKSANYWNRTNSKRWTKPTNSRWTLSWNKDKPWSRRIVVKAGDVIRVKVIGESDGITASQINSLKAYIDVPDLFQYFENEKIPADGKQLDIKIPNYYTVAVRLDAIQNSTAVGVKYITKNPCKIKLIDANGDGVYGEADITWQGYQKEMI